METAISGDRANGARWLNLLLGSWLFVSAFIWPHHRDSLTNTWMIGMLMVTFSTLAMALPGARKVNQLLAVWLFVWTLALDHDNLPTLINNGLVAIAVFGLSLIPPMSLGRRRDVHEAPAIGSWHLQV